MQEQYEDSLNSLKTSAESTGMSVKAYLQRNLGAIMTEKVYNQPGPADAQYRHTPRAILTADLHRRRAGSRHIRQIPRPMTRPLGSNVVVSGAADSTTDADGNTVQATDEEQAAAKETAKATAEEILAAYNSGKSLESIAWQL